MPNGTVSKISTKNRSLRDRFVLGFRFKVDFLGAKGNQTIPDIRFQKVSGLSAEVETTHQPEGGENLYSLQLPDRIKHSNLTLERGFVVDSWLEDQFDEAMSFFKFAPADVLVTML